jgi:hypothetical protein
MQYLNPPSALASMSSPPSGGSVLRCLLQSNRALRIYLRGPKISCDELHFVPVLRSLLRRAWIAWRLS